MAAGTTPIFVATPDNQWIDTVLAANTTTDLTSGTIYLAYTAAATGAHLYRIRFRALGTNVATMARVWMNNGAATGTLANNTLIDEITLPATTVSQTSALQQFELPLGIQIAAGYRIYVTLGTAVAAGFDVCVFGGAF